MAVVWRGLVPGGAGVRRLAPSAPSAAVQAPYSSRTQWYVVLLLTLAATLSFIDRQNPQRHDRADQAGLRRPKRY